MTASRNLPLPARGAALGLLNLIAVAVAVPSASAFDFPGAAKLAPECATRVDKAALQVMKRTLPLGQMQIYGPPATFDPRHLRVTVDVFGARTEIYAVDLSIDDACNVVSASTRLESSEWPLR